MKTRRFQQVDVFTQRPLLGNALAVVLDGEDLTDAQMAASLEKHLAGLARWQRPAGGMFFWLELAEGVDAVALLPKAVAAGIAYVPGSAFYAHTASHPADHRTLRLSFVTLCPNDITEGVAILGRVLREHLDGQREPAP